MTKLDKKLRLKRTTISPYFPSDFADNEKKALADYATIVSPDDAALADVFISNTHTNFELFTKEEVENFKLILHPNSGYDNIPIEFIKKTKAPIVIGNTIRSQAVSQYILSALFSHFEDIHYGSDWDPSRKWDRLLLSDLSISIIGYGHIGKILNNALRPLAKKINVYDPYENLGDLEAKEADVIILCCSLNSSSHHFINKDFLQNVKSTALIINAARGELIKTDDLISFLASHPKAHAILDVFEKEPCDFSIFSHLKNINLSSHIAGVYRGIDQRTLQFEKETIKDFLELRGFDFANKYQKMILKNRLHDKIGII